ncbi:DDE-type integrase/transposase/recombinase [Mesomycoplasma ovipneumoniae]|uniref:DDE-type integrase/transposase/recombinase n=1 Tax=Mesomycoplasma ovipneumoniae TaxID=29562 RepID=UPI0028AFBBE8|nr:DDE-type integrase/transposase/recombinase [Mesomycoplasma ovipneumoniae]WNM16029.1 DDE-type integrase/transposase/recombinase [Mesomycoplasma ovipneumoniae]
MKQYKFTIEDKFKYIKIAQSKLKNAILHFTEEFREIYKNKSKSKKAHKEWMLHIYANNLIRNWQKKFYNNDMKSLISVRGKIKSPRKPKRNIQLTIFLKTIVKFIKKIMENVLRRYGIDPAIVLEELKNENKNKKKIKTKSKIALEFVVFLILIALRFMRKIKVKKPPKKMIYDEKLLEWIRENFILNRKVKGRDVLHNIYKNQGNYVSTYVFQKHYQFLGLKSLAYKKQGKPVPKEKKFTRIWLKILSKVIFSLENFGEKWFADIKFIKINNEWYYLHSIIEIKSNYLLNFSISKTRFSEETINLVKETIKKYNIKPKFFHSDHGVEYANYKFANFLKQNGIKQSMSPKGNALANRPIEYFYAVFQRELINIEDQNFENVAIAHQKISSFIDWYNYERLQSCLLYKTPSYYMR